MGAVGMWENGYFCGLAYLFWHERLDAADLNADGAEVGEAAESEGGDCKSARIERALHGTKLAKRDKFVDHHARPEQVANLRRVVPRHPDQPGNRREDPAENSLQALRKPSHVRPVVNAAHHGVEEREQGNEGYQHRADV